MENFTENMEASEGLKAKAYEVRQEYLDQLRKGKSYKDWHQIDEPFMFEREQYRWKKSNQEIQLFRDRDSQPFNLIELDLLPG